MTNWLGRSLFFAIGALLLVLPIRVPINPYDEGLALVNGLRVLQGDVPFRDYWAIYPPGQSYVLAAFFQFFGTTVLTERVYDTLIRIGLAIAIYFVAARMLRSSRWAIAPYLSGVLMLAEATFYGYAVFPALFFAFVALLFFFLYLESVANRWLLLSGLSIGIVSTFRIDLAVYVGAAISLSLLAFALWIMPDRQMGHVQGRISSRLIAFAQSLVPLAGSAALIALPFYIYLVNLTGFATLWDNLITFPATTFHEVRHLPYPPWLPDTTRWNAETALPINIDRVFGDWFRFYFPLLIYSMSALAILLAALRRWRTPAAFRHDHVDALALTVLGSGLFVQALSRYDGIHVLPTSLCVVILLGWLWRLLPTSDRGWRWVTVVPAVLLLPAMLFYAVRPALQLGRLTTQFPLNDCHSTLARAACMPTVFGNQEEIITALNLLAKAGEPVLLAMSQHDKIFANDVSFYFLAERPIPTRYHEFHPGVTNTQPVQQEIIQELSDGKVDWVVMLDWGNPNEPNGSAQSSGVTDLDEYLRANFKQVQSVGLYQIWQRQS